jgi:hypothetical protein
MGAKEKSRVTAAELIAARNRDGLGQIDAGLASELNKLLQHNDTLLPRDNRRVSKTDAVRFLRSNGINISPAGLDRLCARLFERTSWVTK